MTDNFRDHFRPTASGIRADSVFTNRVSEVAAFDRSISVLTAWLGVPGSVDVDAPRHNLLAFHGIGGIGKTTLIGELERRIRLGPTPAATCRIDFQDPSAFSVEDLILRVRAAVGELGKPCIAFDVALSFYWSIAHPGTSLELYTRSNSVLQKVGEKIGLPDCVEDAVQEVASAIAGLTVIAGAGTRLIQTVVNAVRTKARIRHAIAGCASLPMFLETDSPEESLSYMPALLAWDLQQAGSPRVTVFLDAYEAVTDRGRETERVIQRICYLLPNVLFVTAGRNRIDWERQELEGALDYVGPTCWPDLVGEAQQPSDHCILVGDLSPEDSERYLCNRLRSG
ncbi:MAG: hypothetical protein JWN62_480, partial [Acidimicrobiales bacterium]|nr:hypothetical protein [Acidimicrobiales bacterium]